MKPSELAQIKASLGKLTKGICVNCNKKYKNPHNIKTKKFCSRKCKWLHHGRNAGRPGQLRANKRYRSTERGKQVSRDISRRQYAKHPEKAIARSKFNNALKKGKVKKPKLCQCCENCPPIEAHHWDYMKHLKVMWVCKTCHVAIHKFERQFR